MNLFQKLWLLSKTQPSNSGLKTYALNLLKTPEDVIKQRSLLRGVMAWGLILCFAGFSSCNQRSTKTTSQINQNSQGLLLDSSRRKRSQQFGLIKTLSQSKKGLERSQRWAQYFDSIPISAHKVRPTDEPSKRLYPATNKALSPIIYQANALLDDSFYVNAKSGQWLIVGHSDTTPYWANALLKTDSLSDIPDSINSHGIPD